MPKWNEFVPSTIEYDFDNDELSFHGIDVNEAVQCFYNEYTIRKNKKFIDRFKLLGRTDGGRKLCIIFQLKKERIVRIITGWDI